MTESDEIDLLLELFGWPKNDMHFRYSALRTLRVARRLDIPTWDDFAASVQR